MYRNRIIPCLLLSKDGLVKTIRFKDPKYLGDPINAVKIFNDKEVDELMFLDIDARKTKSEIKFKLLSKIATQSFMPLCYGGGVCSITEIKEILSLGFEKVSINNYLLQNPSFIEEAVNVFGSQSIIASIDIKKDMFGTYKVYNHVNRKITHLNPVEFACSLKNLGSGEIIVNSVDRDGTMQGYDIDLIRQIADAISVPVIACGGAGKLEDFVDVIKQGHASAAAAGSLFVFQGPLRSVLINFPTQDELQKLFPEYEQ